MKLYRTRTQVEYDFLMQKLEDEGCRWTNDELPSEYDRWAFNEDETVIKVNEKEIITHASSYLFGNVHPNEPIIEVSDLMEEKQMKFKVGDEVRVVNAPPGTFRRNYVGEIHEVTQADDGIIPYELSNGFWCREEDIELVVDHDYLVDKVLERNNKPETLKELTEPLDLIDSHKRICERLNKVYADKNHDYGNSFGETYEKLGAISAVTRISDKTSRLQSLVTKDEQRVDDERLIDTALDLANYAIMFAMELEEQE